MSKVRKSTAAGIVCGILLIVACVVIANMGNHGKSANPGPAKYIFLFIGDGMGATHVAAAESYLSYLEGERGLEQVSFTKFPVLGMASTYSADKNITCSSAAGTAISCGEKTNNGMLGITPDGDTLTSIALELKEKGYKIGIMSSVPVNHATPAAFYGHNASRHDYYGITQEIPAIIENKNAPPNALSKAAPIKKPAVPAITIVITAATVLNFFIYDPFPSVSSAEFYCYR